MVGVAVMLILTGLLLYLMGRRGWAQGTHPYCRKCRFNLHALPIDHPRCPECGADIQRPDAIEVGLRRPRLMIMALGALMGFGGSVLLAPPVVGWWTEFDGSAYKPVVWLQADVDSADARAQSRACAELRRRLERGSMSAAAVDRLAQRVLKLQRDAGSGITWNPQWGDLVQLGHKTHTLSPALWRTYLTHAIQVTARVRPRVRIDDPVPLALTCTLRAGTSLAEIVPAVLSPQISARLGALAGPVTMRSAALDSVPMPLEWSALWMPAGTGAAGEWPANGTAAGAVTLQVSIAMTLTDSEKTAVMARVTVPLPVQVLGRTASSVELLSPAAMEADMEQAIRLRRPVGNGSDNGAAISLAETGGALGTLWISGPPMGAAFRVVLRQNGHDWTLARFVARPNDAATVPLRLDVRHLAQGPQDGEAEVVCLPEPALASGTVDMLEVWGGEIHRRLVISVDH